MRTVLRGIPAAAVFLTRIPFGGFPYSKEEWRWASAWFPLVGFGIGCLTAVIWIAVDTTGPWVAAMTVLVVSIMVTGAFHEDGLADTADALGGAYDQERLFAILKDSRVGAFGGLALVITVGFRLVLLASLGGAAPAALVVSHTLARVGPIWLMVAMPYVTGEEAKSRLVTRASAPQGAVATGVGVAVLCLSLGYGAVSVAEAGAVIAAVVGTTAICGWRFRARAGGVTGDFLGAAEQVAEIAILYALLAA